MHNSTMSFNSDKYFQKKATMNVNKYNQTYFDIVYQCTDKVDKDKITVTFKDLSEPQEIKFGIDIKCKPYDGRQFDINILVLFAIAVFLTWVTIRKFP